MEWQGHLPDILDVVDEDAYQMNNESDDESNSYNENNSLNESNSSNEAKIKEYPSYPHTSGRMGATPIDSNHRYR